MPPAARSPLVCLHGFLDSPRTWELVRPALERQHDVLAPALAGHLGGPPLPAQLSDATLADGVEAAMDAAGLQRAHLVGNSLGGYVALQLASRGRALTVVALAPAGGWSDDDSRRRLLGAQLSTHDALRRIAPSADALASTVDGRRRATALTTVRFEHLPAELIADQIRAAAATDAAPLIAHALRHGYPLAAERIECPVRVIWGTEDRLLPWPSAAARYREAWLPHADWVELEGVGHCPQLDRPLETAQLVLGHTTIVAAR
jgi:pimeloyl-ACP methyl ester carboxylesterase